MSERITVWFPLGLLFLLALLTFWLDRAVREPERKLDGSARHDPDYMVDNFLARRMGQDGLPLHTLAAADMVHYPDDDSTHLTRPHFVALDEHRVPIHIVAQQGLVSSNGTDVYFSRGVEVKRETEGGKDWLTIHTESLHIVPDKEYAHTDQAVTIRTPSAVINAVGMDLNNRTRVLKLHTRVRGQYEKPKP